MNPPADDSPERQAHGLIDDGNRLEANGLLRDAHARYLQARDLAPHLPRCHLNVGNILGLLGDRPGAIAAYETALARDPKFAPAFFNLGNLYLAGGQVALAIEKYRQALGVRPGFAEAEVAIGSAYYHLGRWEDAAAAYSRALRLQPNFGNVYLNLGNVLTVQRKFPEAYPVLREAVRLLPGDGVALVTAYHVSLHLCDWAQRNDDEKRLAEMIARNVPGAAAIPLALLNIDLPGHSAALMQRAAGDQFARNRLLGAVFPPPSHVPRPAGAARQLRIGYLSADVYEHPVMHLLKGVLATHDRTRSAIHLYSYGITRDAMTDRIRACVDVFRDISELSEGQAAEVIAGDAVDILVDLQGYTENVRVGIAAHRPAPVLVSWLGYAATLGHPALADYIIGDPVVTPLEAAADFSETLAQLPHCYLPNDRARPVATAPSRQAAGLPPDAFVFCNFNQSAKFSPAMLDLWCRLLHAVPGSVLWLREPPGHARSNILREVAVRGIDVSRVVFAPRVPSNADHLGRLSLADLALDTFPYTSHTTACDALWVGVPLITIRGTTFTSRVAASVLTAAGAGELVASDAESFFAIALDLARDSGRRAQLRSRFLATRLSMPLFDTERFARDLDDLYARIWQQHQTGGREPILATASKTAGT